MDMTVKLQVFEGPLDLLLHLLEKNKVNIPLIYFVNTFLQNL